MPPESEGLHPVFERLGKDHQRISGVLTVLEQSARSDDPDWTLVGACLQYLSEYADAVHHKVEDVVFDNLLQTDITDAQRKAVVTNATQHKSLGESSGRLIADVDMVLQDVVVPLDRILAHLDNYLEAQWAHLHNDTIFPLAQVHIKDAAWEHVSQDLLDIEDPVFQAQAEEYQRLYQEVQALAADST